MKLFTKTFVDPHARHTAQAHHAWLSRVTPTTRLPTIIQTRPMEIDFEYLRGRHANPDDLVALADLLGRQHTAAHATELQIAVLDKPHTCAECTIPGFIAPRRDRIGRLLADNAVPQPLLTPTSAGLWLSRAATMPAAFYKDANPRNFMITPSETVLVDFDSLTLAPFGYDLAKLVVTTCMTSGPLHENTIREALDIYNLHPRSHNLRQCSPREFAAWTEIHHILTAPYLGTHGYRFSWHTLRPRWLTDQLHMLEHLADEP